MSDSLYAKNAPAGELARYIKLTGRIREFPAPGVESIASADNYRAAYRVLKKYE